MSDLDSDARRYRHKRSLTFLYGHDKDGNEGKMSALAVIGRDTGTAFTPVDADNGKVMILTNASAIAVTLPNDKPIGYAVRFVQGGAGVINLAAQSGGSVVGAAATSAQWGGLTALVIDQGINGVTATWLVG